MKTLRLTDDQYTLLQALLNSDVFGWDGTQVVLGNAAAEILDTTGDEEADIEAQIDLQNGLTEALSSPVDEAPDTAAAKC